MISLVLDRPLRLTCTSVASTARSEFLRAHDVPALLKLRLLGEVEGCGEMLAILLARLVCLDGDVDIGLVLREQPQAVVNAP